jgi:hypothetical protein
MVMLLVHAVVKRKRTAVKPSSCELDQSLSCIPQARRDYHVQIYCIAIRAVFHKEPDLIARCNDLMLDDVTVELGIPIINKAIDH